MRRKGISDEECERVDVIKVRRKIKMLSLQFIYALKSQKGYIQRLNSIFFTSFRKTNFVVKVQR